MNHHIEDMTGWTPLHNAAGRGHMNIVTFLVSKGADVNARDKVSIISSSSSSSSLLLLSLLLSSSLLLYIPNTNYHRWEGLHCIGQP